MATTAELLKARLAKYATSTPKPTTGPDSKVDSSEGTGGSPVVAASASTDNMAMAVTTDLQSTTLVIVERPEVVATDVVRAGETAERAGTDLDTSNPVHQNFLQRLSDLETALLERDPLMKTHLGEIHKHMIQYEEIANLLRPAEIAKIMAAQQAHTGVVLRAETLGKSKAAATKKAAKLGVGDL